MNFESDAFISYAHVDNVELIEGGKGWVTNLHRALEVRRDATAWASHRESGGIRSSMVTISSPMRLWSGCNASRLSFPLSRHATSGLNGLARNSRNSAKAAEQQAAFRSAKRRAFSKC